MEAPKFLEILLPIGVGVGIFLIIYFIMVKLFHRLSKISPLVFLVIFLLIAYKGSEYIRTFFPESWFEAKIKMPFTLEGFWATWFWTSEAIVSKYDLCMLTLKLCLVIYFIYRFTFGWGFARSKQSQLVSLFKKDWDPIKEHRKSEQHQTMEERPMSRSEKLHQKRQHRPRRRNDYY